MPVAPNQRLVYTTGPHEKDSATRPLSEDVPTTFAIIELIWQGTMAVALQNIALDSEGWRVLIDLSLKSDDSSVR